MLRIIACFLGSFAKIFTGGSMVFLLLLTGVLLTLRFRFYQVRGARFILKNTICTLFQKDDSPGNSISPFQAVTTALAGTMGVGNIAGVATALVAGGPGAIFWMCVSAFFGMMTKYAEIYLAVRFRKKDAKGNYYGGPMYYIRDGLKMPGLAALFAFTCTICSLGGGNLAQIHSVSDVMLDTWQVPPFLTGIVFAALLGMVIFGGLKRIAKITELVIPFASILYLCFAGAFLYIERAMLPQALRLIFTSAFGLRPAAGGMIGYGAGRAVYFGLSRGVFTNEAGLGSAPIAHAAANCKGPAQQASWGIFEVFLDTIVVCSITALVLLCADNGSLWNSGLDGAPLTSRAFESLFPGIGAGFIAVSIAFFAFAAMVGWCFYGEQTLSYLTKGSSKATTIYRILYILSAMVGSAVSLKVVWGISDFMNAMMAVPNIIALVGLRNKVRVKL